MGDSVGQWAAKMRSFVLSSEEGLWRLLEGGLNVAAEKKPNLVLALVG